MDIYEAQARYYSNIPIIDRRYKSCVHIEDKEDEKFWDYHLQHITPAKYFFISHSKSGKGKETTGCEQCLKYRPFLSKNFFICIDSDLRLLKGERDLDAKHYIAQTYTYSWENHCCEAMHLQDRLRERIPEIDSIFDFRVFLSKLSDVMDMPLKLLLYYNAKDNSVWNLKKFTACVAISPLREMLDNNGESIIAEIKENFKRGTQGIAIPDDFSTEMDIAKVYLYIRGHQLYNLISAIGKMLCSGKQIAFSSEILDANYPLDGYEEVKNLHNDLKIITKI